MKTVIAVLFLATVVSGQFFNPFAPRQRPQQQQFRQPQRQASRGAAVHDRGGNTEYHYSWRVTNQKFTGGEAINYCRRIGFQPISITNNALDAYVKRVLEGDNVSYIWTSGAKSGNGFVWGTGERVQPLNWSHTGGARRPQPDNREGDENCLAVLNDFYNDGVKWHDVSCHHLKPIICVRN